MNEEFIDEPLQTEVQKSIERTFEQYYHWTIGVKNVACDSTFGRFRREFDRRQPSMINIMRIRSLGAAQKSLPPQKRRISHNLLLEIGTTSDASLATGPTSTLAWLKQLRLCANTWAITGCFDVSYNGEQVKYVHWQDALKYVEEFEEKAWEVMGKFEHDSVFRYLSETEEVIRAKAVELARDRSQMPWGKALLSAIEKESRKWSDAREKLKAVPQGNKQNGGSGNKGRGAVSPGPGSVSEPPAAGQTFLATALNTDDGKKICKRYNDKRGCGQRCPKGDMHVCDVLLAKTGRVCGKKDHNRTTHDSRAHGTPQTDKTGSR